jgi:hypothetical protein
MTPSHWKWRDQRWRRGLNNGMMRPVSGSQPLRSLDFVPIAVLARPREVGRVIRSVVLPGDDVFNVKGKPRLMVFMQLTVFTAIPGPLANELPGFPLHAVLALRER